ncbi:MAG TPA: hypothetical protein VLJ37_02200 [bacterium]|nr:hypothetical protein [bacterium]
MKRILTAIVLLTCMGWGTAWGYHKGVVLGLYSKDPDYNYENEIREIKALGATHVSLVVSWYQKDIHANEIYPRWKPLGDFDTTPDEKLVQVIGQARRSGLEVFLFPILRLEERKPKEWRGVIAPGDVKIWQASYRRFVMHYARIAAQHGVALYLVGSELCSQEQDVDFWKSLIADVRKVYRGEILYSANWDHYKKIGFWDDLDYLGLNGYYEMAKSSSPTVEEIVRRWWDISNEIAAWQETHKKKLIFTEIGYPSVDGGCAHPWDYTRPGPVDLEEQSVCYEAFFLSWNKSRNLGGVYFWNWYGQGGENDRSYTPRGKPAEKVLTRWYRDDSSSSPASSPPVARPAPAAAQSTGPSPLPTSSAAGAAHSSFPQTPTPLPAATR